MEPTSIVSLAGACLTLVVRTTRDLNDIAAKFHKMEQMVRLLVAQLNTITTTLAQLDRWLNRQPDLGSDVSGALAGAIEACTTVVNELAGFVARLKGGWLSSRFLWIWDEGQFAQYQRALDSQITALGLFLNVILLNSHTRRHSVLDVATNRNALREARDQASICSHRRRSTVSVGRSSADGLGRDVSSSSTLADPVTPLSPAAEALSTEFSPIAALPPLTGSAGRRDSDAATVTTTWTSSTGSSSRSSVFELEKLGRPRSWSSRGRQAHLAQNLCAAARAGDDATIRSLVGQGVDVNNSRYGLQPLDDGPERERERRLKSVLQRNLEPTPLHYAAEGGHASAVETLVSCGAELGARARRGRTPLHVASGAAIAALIQLGADTCARDEADQVPLHRLAADGQLEGVDAVLAAGTSPVDAQNKARQTPLHLACQNNHHDVAHALLGAGAYVNAADRDGLRPLHYLARHGRPPLVRLLRDANADVEAQALHLLRPLHDAARTGCPAVVEALLAASADIEATTDDGSTPLHLAVAATNDAPATVAVLLAARANVAAETAKNEQPLHLALRRGSVAIAALLLQHGADANARLRDGTVPLIQACSSTAAAQGTLSTVETLLARGADPSATNRPGASPLSAACSRPELASDLVRLLVANGASPRHQDFRALWRNGKLSIWEKRAAHAIMTEAAAPELRKSEVEWLMVAR
ncbi:hypothetical protein SLS58_010659 [Diplodia intermedia]|uniref:Ankyrin repeat protein n=1 Tax=Diplodia intermedia TaxID=856260 RepID=A0ABR3T4G2_9PEZI